MRRVLYVKFGTSLFCLQNRARFVLQIVYRIKHYSYWNSITQDFDAID